MYVFLLYHLKFNDRIKCFFFVLILIYWLKVLPCNIKKIYLLQIRQEKPYYIADPEVDSLVSIKVCRIKFLTFRRYKRVDNCACSVLYRL